MPSSVLSFGLSTKIFFGIEALRELPAIGKDFGNKVLVVSGKHSATENGVLRRVGNLLSEAGFSVTVFPEVEAEPSLATVSKGIALARKQEADWVVGLGGGSAMDAAKAVAGLFRAGREIDYYFEGGPIEAPGLPLVTIPTTAGSGAEVTVNAVLSDPDRRIKQSIRGQDLAARAAIVDPQLTFSLPSEVTAYSGLDALVQAIEAFTSRGSNPLTDIYAVAAIEKIGANLLKAVQDPQNVQARTEMALGSLMAGVALTNARLGAVHGLAHAIGIRTGKPHGLVCAVLLIPVMRFNMPASYEKYAQISKALGHNIAGMDPIDAAAMGIKTIMNLLKKLAIPPHISSLGITETDLPEIVEASLPSGSLKANPREASRENLLNILRENF
jgi:alcohol dehydrogenase class IV